MNARYSNLELLLHFMEQNNNLKWLRTEHTETLAWFMSILRTGMRKTKQCGILVPYRKKLLA